MKPFLVCGEDRGLLYLILVRDERGALNIEVVETSPFSLLPLKEPLSTTYQARPDHC